MEAFITREYLQNNPDKIFVFGDNLFRSGYGGAAKLRDASNSYGFITKKYPNNKDESFYKPEEYREVYKNEIVSLRFLMEHNRDVEFLISKLGAGLANKYGIFEEVIEPHIKADLSDFENVRFLW